MRCLRDSAWDINLYISHSMPQKGGLDKTGTNFFATRTMKLVHDDAI